MNDDVLRNFINPYDKKPNQIFNRNKRETNTHTKQFTLIFSTGFPSGHVFNSSHRGCRSRSDMHLQGPEKKQNQNLNKEKEVPSGCF